MKSIKITLLILSVFSLTAINALSVQDLIDKGQCPEIETYHDDNSIIYLENGGVTESFETYLDLSHKNLTSLDGLQNIPNIESIHNLNLSHNNLTQIPDNIFNKLKNVKVLNLSHNKLIKLPNKIFDNLIKLEIINISENQLTSLSENIFLKLKELTSIDLLNNYLDLQVLKCLKEKIRIHIAGYKTQKNILDHAKEKLHNKSVFDALRTHSDETKISTSFKKLKL